MTCPKCQAPMRQYERSGVTVDQCTECRGIFLDRGELERLADAENAWHGAPQPPPAPTAPPPPQYQQQPQQQPRRGWDSGEYPQYGHGGYGHRRKKRSFLGELFD